MHNLYRKKIDYPKKSVYKIKELIKRLFINIYKGYIKIKTPTGNSKC